VVEEGLTHLLLQEVVVLEEETLLMLLPELKDLILLAQVSTERLLALPRDFVLDLVGVMCVDNVVLPLTVLRLVSLLIADIFVQILRIC
jgi:hypothetical protein